MSIYKVVKFIRQCLQNLLVQGSSPPYPLVEEHNFAKSSVVDQKPDSLNSQLGLRVDNETIHALAASVISSQTGGFLRFQAMQNIKSPGKSTHNGLKVVILDSPIHFHRLQDPLDSIYSTGFGHLFNECAASKKR